MHRSLLSKIQIKVIHIGRLHLIMIELNCQLVLELSLLGEKLSIVSIVKIPKILCDWINELNLGPFCESVSHETLPLNLNYFSSS